MLSAMRKNSKTYGADVTSSGYSYTVTSLGMSMCGRISQKCIKLYKVTENISFDPKFLAEHLRTHIHPFSNLINKYRHNIKK